MKETVPTCPPLKTLARILLQHYASLIYMCLLRIHQKFRAMQKLLLGKLLICITFVGHQPHPGILAVLA